MHCIALNYCCVCCYETTLLFIWNIAMSVYQIILLHSPLAVLWCAVLCCWIAGVEASAELVHEDSP